MDRQRAACLWGWPAGGLAALVLGAGCLASCADLSARLGAADPAVRIRAIHEVVRQQRTDLLSILVDRLDDEDAAVRLYAIGALQRLTGQRLGYSYTDRGPARRRAIATWRRFLEQWAPAGPAAGGAASH